MAGCTTGTAGLGSLEMKTFFRAWLSFVTLATAGYASSTALDIALRTSVSPKVEQHRLGPL